MPIPALPRDVWLLLACRAARMFGFGALAVAVGRHLSALGLAEAVIGLLLGLAFWGDAAVALPLALRADRWGRRRTLLLGAGLMLLAGIVLASAANPWILALGLAVGVLSPNAAEAGPFLAVEQACLSQLADPKTRTTLFAWANLLGYASAALGSLAAGWATNAALLHGWAPEARFRPIFEGYCLLAGMVAWWSFRLSPAVEPPAPSTSRGWGAPKSKDAVTRLSALFALDAFGGGFVAQALLAQWLARRHGCDDLTLGQVFFAANLLSGLSGLLAARLAGRFGLLNVMVWSHVPSNLLLIAAGLAPSAEWAIAFLLLRHTMSQMDVPTRQSYTMAVTPPEERAAAAGLTGVARTLGAGLGSALGGTALKASALVLSPPVVGGALKLAYDGLLWASCRRLPELDRKPAG